MLINNFIVRRQFDKTWWFTGVWGMKEKLSKRMFRFLDYTNNKSLTEMEKAEGGDLEK